MIGEARVPIPAKKGRLRRVDYEYKRNGTANLFVTVDRHAGRRKVNVTDRRTKIDFAQQMKEQIDDAVRSSRWVRLGGLRVTTLVLAQDGVTWLYVDGHGGKISPEGLAPTEMIAEWIRRRAVSAAPSSRLICTAIIWHVVMASSDAYKSARLSH